MTRTDFLIISALVYIHNAVAILEDAQTKPRVPLVGPFPFEVIS